ncbi:hypothetical protein SLH46_16995 [Draconibacterium sp. IB214405]|nr:hypothetical protein [Draconibacterium sp. IB214405]MDX8339860.1 hypothetical protein [Draconibacterium sp. IB214405]MDX8340898.1 hypothetical protein [Draconibacterium sp. IB214405]
MVVSQQQYQPVLGQRYHNIRSPIAWGSNVTITFVRLLMGGATLP